MGLGTFKTVIPESKTLHIDKRTVYGLIGLATLFGIICFAALGFLTYHRKRKVVRYSTASFCMIMLFGCSLGCFSAIPFGYVNHVACALRPSMLIISFTLIYIPLIVKSYRVFRLFGTKRLSAIKITDKQLAVAMLFFVVVDFLIIACWIGIPKARPVPNLVASQTADYTYEWHCSAPVNNTVAVIVVVYKALTLVVGLIFAYYSRNAPSLFNESAYTASALYIFTIIVGTGIPLQSLIKGQPSVIFAIRTVVICLACFTTCVQFFAPKFYLLLTVKDGEIQGFDDPATSRRNGNESR